ncbi:type II toxin-antitoxin system VapC family toxin [Polaromonas sp.]|uniref:type II toxin-antitoxin system VapC family toxin n=1 Tax=Polaromonas sp. TaxID=1869339 RepID=UPI00286A6510|nr:type II toxin-antitoxin system VapC family toxin [Polaromonas sp.]
MRAIDANVLVRALVNDNAAQSARAVALLTEHDIFIPVTVVLELEWVLRSRYAFAPKVVGQAIEKIAALGNVVVGERAAVLAAAARAVQGWDFADALHHALSHGCEDFCTLDTNLVKRAARATPGGAKVTPMVTKL